MQCRCSSAARSAWPASELDKKSFNAVDAQSFYFFKFFFCVASVLDHNFTSTALQGMIGGECERTTLCNGDSIEIGRMAVYSHGHALLRIIGQVAPVVGHLNPGWSREHRGRWFLADGPGLCTALRGIVMTILPTTQFDIKFIPVSLRDTKLG
jgi:hypothetical protein